MQSRRRNKAFPLERSRSRSAPHKQGYRGKDSGPPEPQHRGVSLQVLDGVPVVHLDAESPFYEHASWLLQTALQSTAKADSLYESVEDRAVERKFARELDVNPDEMALVRIKDPALQDVLAIGTNGKRSVMLAVVIAMLLRQKSQMINSVCKELWAVGLNDSFLELVRSSEHRTSKNKGDANRQRDGSKPWQEAKDNYGADDDRWGGGGAAAWGWKDKGGGGSTSSSWKGKPDWKEGAWDSSAKDVGSRSSGEDPLQGVDVHLILRNVPVVDLEPSSVFHENISWLLQTAFDVSGKADATFEYYDDARILSECQRKFGLSPQETGTARCRRKDLQHIMAVGTCGKRSTMLAILIAYALHAEDNLDFMREDVRKFDAKLGEAFDAFIRLAAELAGIKLAWADGGWAGSSRRNSGRPGEESWGGERWKSEASSWQAGGRSSRGYGSGGFSKKETPRARKMSKSVLDADDLDTQLDQYFQDD